MMCHRTAMNSSITSNGYTSPTLCVLFVTLALILFSPRKMIILFRIEKSLDFSDNSRLASCSFMCETIGNVRRIQEISGPEYCVHVAFISTVSATIPEVGIIDLRSVVFHMAANKSKLIPSHSIRTTYSLLSATTNILLLIIVFRISNEIS